MLTMKIRILYFLLALILGILIFSLVSCSKNKDDRKSLNEYLTTGTWKRTAMTSDPGWDYNNDGEAETDVYAAMDPCFKDDTWTYKADGTCLYNQGADKCDPSGEQTELSDWEIIDDGKKIVLYGNVYDLLQLDANTLKFKSQFTDNNILYTEIYTYGH